MILSSFFKALRQIGDRRFRQVLFLGIGVSTCYAGAVGLFNDAGCERDYLAFSGACGARS